MTWDEVFNEFQRTSGGPTLAGFLTYLRANYADPMRMNLCRIYAAGKTYDWKDTIKGYGDRLFRWDAQLKRWYADVQDGAVDKIAAELKDLSQGAVEIKVDTDYKRADPPPRDAKPGAAYSYESPQGQEEIPEEEVPF